MVYLSFIIIKNPTSAHPQELYFLVSGATRRKVIKMLPNANNERPEKMRRATVINLDD